MGTNSITKTMRQNKEVAAGKREILELNPRLEKESDVFSYAYNQMAMDILNKIQVDFDEIALLDYHDRTVDIEFADTVSVSIDERDYKVVLEHFSERPNVHRVQFAYLTRLVLLYTRKKLRESKGIINIPELVNSTNITVEVTEQGEMMMWVGSLFKQEANAAKEALIAIENIKRSMED